MANKFIIFGATYNGDGTTSSEAAGTSGTVAAVFTLGTPGKIKWTGHGLAANTIVFFIGSGTLPTGITAGTTYYVRNPGTNDFEISATSGGASIALSGSPTGNAAVSTQGAWSINRGGGLAVSLSITYANADYGSVNQGAQNAGDTITMRSKSGAGVDGDITVTMSGSITLGSSSATETAPITWILDDGTVWSGKNGTLTYTSSSTSYTITLRGNNIFHARTEYHWILENTATSPPAGMFVLGGISVGMKFNLPNKNAASTGYIALNAASPGDITYAIRPYFYFNNIATYAFYTTLGTFKAVLESPVIELANAPSAATPLFRVNTTSIFVNGGQIIGSGTASNVYLADTTAAGEIACNGLVVPKAILPASQASTPVRYFRLSCKGLDGATGGALVESWGHGDSLNLVNNYPTLNALNPDSGGTGLSWKIWPRWATRFDPAKLSFSKLYTSAHASKTITTYFCAETPWGGSIGLDKSTVWVEISYTDHTTGAHKHISSLEPTGGSLTSSSAGWSSTSWGAVSLSKYEIALTTPTDIKQDTDVIITWHCSAAASGTNDILFVDPDPQFS